MSSLKGSDRAQRSATGNHLVCPFPFTQAGRKLDTQICIKREPRDGLMVKVAQLPAFSEYLSFLPRNLAGCLTTSHTFSSGGIQNPLLASEGPPLPQHTCVSYTYEHTTETKINLKTCIKCYRNILKIAFNLIIKRTFNRTETKFV